MTDLFASRGLRRALIAGGLMGAAIAGGIADAGQRDAKVARRDAERAAKALGAHDAAAAVALAERAVSIDPRDAGYRLLLGQSYLAAGRFASARSALGDAMTLAPANGKVALNLALATIATGDWQAAQQVLSGHRNAIPATDLGLAVALAGDPAGGAAILTAAVRAPDATVKTRQNLALVLALAGRWDMARIVAATDLAPGQLDQRMQEWTLFAQPHSASDQVAQLLSVRPIADPGLPVALALAAPVAVMPAAPVQAGGTIAAPITSAPALPVPAPTAAATTIAAPPAAPAAPPVRPGANVEAAGFSRVVFGPPSPVVQPLPPAPVRPVAGAVRASVSPASPASGRWFVQLGAFASARNAEGAWHRLSRRLPDLARYDAHGVPVAIGAGTLYRLSVGGFDRGAADRLCARYRSAGGACFVRASAGDQVARWVNRGQQRASG